MMEYLGIASTSTLSSPICRYWCECCRVESQFVDTNYLTYPSTSTSVSTSSTFWKSSGTSSYYTPSTYKTYAWPEPDED